MLKKNELGNGVIIVSRHAGAIEFLRTEMPEIFADAPVIAEATAEDVEGKIVGGNLPLDLASKAYMVFAVLFKSSPPRGREYGPKEMRDAGAYVAPFHVSAGWGIRCPFCGERNWDGWHCCNCGAT